MTDFPVNGLLSRSESLVQDLIWDFQSGVFDGRNIVQRCADSGGQGSDGDRLR